MTLLRRLVFSGVIGSWYVIGCSRAQLNYNLIICILRGIGADLAIILLSAGDMKVLRLVIGFLN